MTNKGQSCALFKVCRIRIPMPTDNCLSCAWHTPQVTLQVPQGKHSHGGAPGGTQAVPQAQSPFTLHSYEQVLLRYEFTAHFGVRSSKCVANNYALEYLVTPTHSNSLLTLMPCCGTICKARHSVGQPVLIACNLYFSTNNLRLLLSAVQR